MEVESKRKKKNKRKGKRQLGLHAQNEGPKIKQGDMKVCLKAKVNGDGPHQ